MLRSDIILFISDIYVNMFEFYLLYYYVKDFEISFINNFYIFVFNISFNGNVHISISLEIFLLI